MTRSNKFSKAQLIIPTFNRPQLLLKSVESALNQRLPFDRIVISDNSYPRERRRDTKEIMATHLANHSDRLTLQFPPEPLSAQGHAKFIQETNCISFDYTMLLHDDDRLEPHFLEKMKLYLDANPELVAVAANAWAVNFDERRVGTVMRRRHGTKTLHSPLELLRPYLDIWPTGPAPLDSYLYRSDALRKISFDSSHGGKYSDVAALAELVTYGPILWHYEPLMSYLQHPNQDSRAVSTRDFRNLTYHLQTNYPSLELEQIVANFRFKHFRLKAKTLSSQTKVRTRRKLQLALCFHAMRHLINRMNTYMLLLRRLCRM